ncbi:TIGR04219 family outer membrane beta-barrel protein [Rheinheimera sediminis]|uniref:TIGR04219 family outer membrane beta-barrel protein n=1 Tax=Rheinheimera sp. YQF-1 TaxID=2499626 RepID=UPI000FDB840E|nr:TIGR04219 family outer membrane beta-barrel protein [Rheinheimera sp. YQF-1]RVT46523.1 TIGR04219 family outer membrane beta-barrel protein [Rheinheimera sp. YQF-1]
MKKSVVSMVFVAALAAPLAMADTVAGLYIGADLHFAEAKGGFGQTGNQQGFSFEDEKLSSFYVKVEHPVPFLPNIKLQRNGLSSNGNTSLSRTFEFDDQIFAIGTQVDQDVDLSNLDATFYYEILDNDLVSLDLGITAKYIDGDISVATAGRTATQDLSAVIPMGYAYGSFGLLGTATKIYTEINYVSYDGSTLSDMQVGLAYKLVDSLAVDLSLKAGIKQTKLELDDIDNIDADLTFDGAFVSAELHF